MDKDALRKEIDSIDTKILDLLETRISCAKEIGRVKAQTGEEVYVPSREVLVFKNLLAKNGGRINESALRAIYREIISASISAEKKLMVAYLGPKATFTQQAAIKNFGSSVDYRPMPSIPDVFAAVENGDADYGVIPIENSTEGAVFHSMDMLRDSSLFNSILGNSKYANLAQDLQKLLNDAGFLRPFELFNSILIRFDGRKRFIARMGGEVEDVLDEFLNLALKFETNHTPTLEAFISWILSDKVIVKKEMEQGDSDTVKIMTAHGSKGLQAPIVILADTVRTKDKKRDCRFLWDKEDLFYFPLCSAAYDKHCNELRDDEIDADFDEYRRLLYVALTRAEDRLYIAGFSKSDKIDNGSWYNLLVLFSFFIAATSLCFVVTA